MLVRKVNKAMLIDDSTNYLVYMDNARVSVDITDENAYKLMNASDELFEAYIGLIVNDAEHELFLKEIEEEEEEEEEEKCN